MPPSRRARPTEAEIARRMASAVGAHRAGRLDEAIAGYRAIVAIAPNAAEAHNNLGTALKGAGRLDAAIGSIQRAVELRPDYGMAHANLASALAAAGQASRALQHWLAAYRLSPDSPAVARGLAGTIRPMRFTAASPALRRALEKLLRSGLVEPQPLAPAAISLLRLEPHIARLSHAATEGDHEALDRLLSGRDGDRLFRDPLLEGVLLFCLVVDESLEHLLATLRRRYLPRAASGKPLPEPDTPEAEFMAALACQCFSNGYIWEVEQEEARQARCLLATPAAERASALLVAAMYHPLFRLPFPPSEPADPPPNLVLLIRRQWHEPLREQRLADAIPKLTKIEDQASRAVREQYEADPYPRWHTTRSTKPRPIGDVVRSLFPQLDLALPAAEAPRILVAGCGTGKHAIEVATRYAGADVLAIDLSLASLAYARRKAEELGLENLRFAQADILGLDRLEERFDLVESLGVLHHMADPEAGWRVLSGLLEPQGLMRIGLYSTRARERIHCARDRVRSLGLEPTPEGIKSARTALRLLSEEDPARSVTRELDFFSASGCRDFLFHARETAYTLPDIAAMLDRLALDFLGFETFSNAPKQLYARRFPTDPAMTSLANWDHLEQEEPSLFHNMYQFWCRSRRKC